jgi:hypothetical protein
MHDNILKIFYIKFLQETYFSDARLLPLQLS